MKGQILVVHRATHPLPDELHHFLGAEDATLDEAETIWLGRLAGSIVGFATTIEDERGITLSAIYVGEELRKMNIGRYLVREIRRLAGSGNDPALLSISAECSAHPFFRAIESELS